MHLADRRSRQRFVVELREQLGNRFAELRFDDLPDFRDRHRRHLIPELRQFIEIVRGEEIGPGGKHLAELDRGRAKLFERQPERFRIVWTSSSTSKSGRLFGREADG